MAFEYAKRATCELPTALNWQFACEFAKREIVDLRLRLELPTASKFAERCDFGRHYGVGSSGSAVVCKCVTTFEFTMKACGLREALRRVDLVGVVFGEGIGLNWNDIPG